MIIELPTEHAPAQQFEQVDSNKRYRLLLDSLPITGEIENALDVGCGLGVNARTLVGKFGCNYYGVDDSEYQIAIAQKILEDEGRFIGADGNGASMRQRIRFHVGDATRLDQIPSLPSEFGMVVSRHPQISYGTKTTFQEIFEVSFKRLAKGGVFLVTTLNKNEYRNSRKAFKKLGIEILQRYCGANQHSNGRDDKYVLLGIKSL